MAADNNMTRMNFFLPQALIEQLKEKDKTAGTPMSEHVRAALAEYLKQDAAA